MAIAKPDNTILFPYVDPNAPSASEGDAIRKNIGYFALHFWGSRVEGTEVDDIFSGVFSPLETTADAPTAWAGVCSYFIRHPNWTFF
jgi:hypothetical protein